MEKDDKKGNELLGEMLPEYDFSQGVRGKHYQKYQQGHSVKIHKKDGSTVTHYYTLEDGAVMLAPDVRVYFPDSDAVNEALRTLIRLMPAGLKKTMA